MLATIILDTFARKEALEIAAALDELCSPEDAYCFSSAAIYAFWSVPRQELLYIGLAKDVASRFRQHTGLVDCAAKCCKREQIDEYFTTNERLGYSVMVQSSLMQPTTKVDEKAIAKALLDDPFSDEVDLEDIFGAEESIAVAEGMLLELHRQLGDKLPIWNKIGGSIAGRKRRSLYEYTAHMRAIQGILAGKLFEDIEMELEEAGFPFELLLNLEGAELSVLNAHSTLREMSADPTTAYYETLLHGVRMLVATQLVPYETAMKLHERSCDTVQEYFDEMKAVGYLQKVVSLLGVQRK